MKIPYIDALSNKITVLMIKYMLFLLIISGTSCLSGQNPYSRQLQDSINILENEYSSLRFSGWLSLHNDTLTFGRESNGVAGEGTSIPVKKVTCRKENLDIIFSCTDISNNADKCIVDYVVLMNNGGVRKSFMVSYTLEFFSGTDESLLKRFYDTLAYVMNTIHGQ